MPRASSKGSTGRTPSQVFRLHSAAADKPLLKAPGGIAADIGNSSFDSGPPSPSAAAKKRTKKVGGAPWFSFWQRNALPNDPWLTKGTRSDLDNLPPDHNTSSTFKRTFDKWLDSIKADGGRALEKDIKRRRLASFGLDKEGSKALPSESNGAIQPTHAQRRAPLPPTLPQPEPSAAPKYSKLISSEALEFREESRQQQVPKRLSANRPPVISTQLQGASEADPLSPSAVPNDGHVAIPETPCRGGYGSKNAFGRQASGHEEGFGPPKRSGWISASTGGAWQRHPECLDWLHEPDEGVFFHLPSDTMWREDQYHGVTDDAYVKLEPVISGSSDNATLPEVFYDNYVKLEPSQLGAKQETLRAEVSVPSAGWEPVAGAARSSNPWHRHPSCQGWLHEPEQGVYFNEETETLWLADDSVTLGNDRILLHPVDAPRGQQPPAGTLAAPSRSSPRFASPTSLR